MTVLCFRKPREPGLTKGKTYEVLQVVKDRHGRLCYELINDFGQQVTCSQIPFRVVQERFEI